MLSRKKNAAKVERHGVVEEFYGKREDDHDEEKKEQTPVSVLGNMIFLLTLSFILGIGWLVWQTWVPQDLTQLPGYRKAEEAPDIPDLLHKADKSNSVLTFTESDVNRYLASTLKASQNGVLSPFARPSGVGIRFHDDFMEVILERHVLSDVKQTVSMFISIRQEEKGPGQLPVTSIEFCEGGKKNHYVNWGGTLGSITVPQGYMIFLRPAFENLATAYKDFLSSLIDSGRLIQFSDGHVDLVPIRRDAEF